MNKISIYGFLLMAAIQFTACSEEEALTPSGSNDDFFSVPADATDPESVLRRNFYEETGIHLLFSELLRSTVVGVDDDGNDIVRNETIDFRWSLTSYNDGLEYEGGYITDYDEQKKVVDLFNSEILPHIKGSSLSPYSVLLFSSLEGRESSWKPMADLYTLSCWRCLGINTGGWIEATSQDERDVYTASICKDIVSMRFSAYSDVAKPWMDISEELERAYIVDVIGDDWDRDITKIYELGYMEYDDDWNDRLYRDRLPYSDDDFEAYFDAIFDRDETDFEAEFGQYPKIMEKYRLMKSLIESTGYKF